MVVTAVVACDLARGQRVRQRLALKRWSVEGCQEQRHMRAMQPGPSALDPCIWRVWFNTYRVLCWCQCLDGRRGREAFPLRFQDRARRNQ